MRFPAVLLAAATLLAGCHKDKPTPPPPTVIVATPLRERVVDWDDYAGRFESIDAVDLRPRVSGYLRAVYFRDGAQVKKGQLLFQIDPRPYAATLAQASAQLARARATLGNAQVELKRAGALYAAQAGSQQDVDARRAAAAQASADLGAAEANRRAAALNVEFTQVRAPISGRISDRRVAPGNLVAADQTLLTSIVDDDPIRFSFEASEALFLKRARAARRATGDPVDVRLADEPDYRWHGRLEFLDNQLDVNSGVIRGRAVLPNPGGLLTPGLFGHMRLPGSAPYDGLLVPDDAVVPDQQRQVVLVVAPNGMVRQQVVTTGPLIAGLRVIKSGIGPNDRIVITGVGRAKAGKKVTARAGRITRQPAATLPAFDAPAASIAAPA